MIETLKNTALYKSLNLNKGLSHAYLFYSLDSELNNNIGMLFAKSLVCENKTICNNCFSCKQFNSKSHPDFIEINQESVKVDDVNNLIAKLASKPSYNQYKVILILNAENINEIAQNKLLKSLEEPNASTIFILTSSKIDKLLPTILSRLKKINLPKISKNDLQILGNELKQNNVDINNYLNTDFNLTDIINYETNPNYKKTTIAIKYIFENLKSSQDIPIVVNSMPDYDKHLLLPIMEKLFLSCVKKDSLFSEDLTYLINQTYPTQAIINSLPHIEEAYKKQMANVNLSYILDNLLFNILKEKFLCKQ